VDLLASPALPALHDQYALLHMTPLFDQQLAGSSQKLAVTRVWAIAFTIFSRAEEDVRRLKIRRCTGPTSSDRCCVSTERASELSTS